MKVIKGKVVTRGSSKEVSAFYEPLSIWDSLFSLPHAITPRPHRCHCGECRQARLGNPLGHLWTLAHYRELAKYLFLHFLDKKMEFRTV
ncbi:MAG TPA: hypothetical protein PKY35_07000 [Candidatus Hydrogenedentes bacterium]|nr:hypothetical protein [Candidatus Hydrogenedentota bacterium]HOL76762.1 hypothetical protein [Candidatus Hydrogenedentota bacterium]HPO85277.1 hypothetical protein [Candidatus Hydrogenedentota bacterium]